MSLDTEKTLHHFSISDSIGSYRYTLQAWGHHADRSWTMQLHRHDFIEMCYVNLGCASYEIEGIRHEVGKGDLFFSCPDQKHMIIPDKEQALEVTFWYLNLEREPVSNEAGTDALFQRLIDKKFPSKLQLPELQHGLTLIQAECESRTPGFLEAMRGLFTKVLIDILRSQIDPEAHVDLPPALDESDKMLRDMIAYLNEHMDRDVALGELAEAFNMSTRHLVRTFGKKMGMSPKQYLISLRIDRASKLLAMDRQLSIKQIATTVGFANAHHFSQVFRKKLGMSPSEFRAVNS